MDRRRFIAIAGAVATTLAPASAPRDADRGAALYHDEDGYLVARFTDGGTVRIGRCDGPATEEV